MRTVLITGASGFLASACARTFYTEGWYVIGVSRSSLSSSNSIRCAFNRWISAEITLDVLEGLEINPDVVIHCSGCSSVSHSIHEPLSAFNSIVKSTAIIIDYLRNYSPHSTLLYPSSAAVYGQQPDKSLVEAETPQPISPYGHYKLIVETLLASYVNSFGQKAISVRFFSIYGPNLYKQLLWDASMRILSDQDSLVFYGTGNETRDWIHVDDAAALLMFLANKCSDISGSYYDVFNGSSGDCVTVSDVLHKLSHALKKNPLINFDGNIRNGDPQFYRADTSHVFSTGWRPAINLDDGLAKYSEWIYSIS